MTPRGAARPTVTPCAGGCPARSTWPSPRCSPWPPRSRSGCPDPGVPLGAVAPSFAVGTLAFGWHRVAPMAALTVGLTGLAVVPGAFGVDPATGLRLVRHGDRAAGVGRLPRPPPAARAGDRVRACWRSASSCRRAGRRRRRSTSGSWPAAPGWPAGPSPPGRCGRSCRKQRAAARRAAGAVAGRGGGGRGAAADRPRDARRRLAQRQRHDAARERCPPAAAPRPGRGAGGAETVERTGRESLAEMHRMLGVLRGPDADETPPHRASPGWPSCWIRPAPPGSRSTLTVAARSRPLPPGLDLAAYRIVQEAITNVLRHAAARPGRLHGGVPRDRGRPRVVDDGAGARLAGADGHGLVGMRERAAVYGGTVEAGPARRRVRRARRPAVRRTRARAGRGDPEPTP